MYSRLSGDHSLGDHIIDVSPALIGARLADLSPQPAFERGERPLRARAVFLLIRVPHKIFRVLVERVVGQMHAPAVDGPVVVGLRREACEALVVQIDHKWVPGGHQHVEADVGLEAIEQEGRVNVAAGHPLMVEDLIDEDVGTLAGERLARAVQEDATAAVGSGGLQDPRAPVVLRHLSSEGFLVER